MVLESPDPVLHRMGPTVCNLVWPAALVWGRRAGASVGRSQGGVPRCPLAGVKGPGAASGRKSSAGCLPGRGSGFRVQGPAGAVGSMGSLQLIPWLQLLFMLLSELELQYPRRSGAGTGDPRGGPKDPLLAAEGSAGPGEGGLSVQSRGQNPAGFPLCVVCWTWGYTSWHPLPQSPPQFPRPTQLA